MIKVGNLKWRRHANQLKRRDPGVPQPDEEFLFFRCRNPGATDNPTEEPVINQNPLQQLENDERIGTNQEPQERPARRRTSRPHQRPLRLVVDPTQAKTYTETRE